MISDMTTEQFYDLRIGSTIIVKNKFLGIVDMYVEQKQRSPRKAVIASICGRKLLVELKDIKGVRQ